MDEIKGNDPLEESSIIRKRCDNFSDTENPKVTMCPTSFEVRLSPGERNRLIFWQEPTFTDNVAVEHVYKTRVRGTFSYFISLSIFKFAQFSLIRRSECIAGKSFYLSVTSVIDLEVN